MGQGYPVTTELPMLHAVSGPEFTPSDMRVWSTTRNVGLAFIEDIGLAVNFTANAGRYYDHILAGSTWCANELTAIGVKASPTIQGVDYDLFNQRVFRCDINPNNPTKKRFNIGSFGKFEYRKGQDIVIAAFKSLVRTYPDMHLICGWANVWPETMMTMNRSTCLGGARFKETPSDWRSAVETLMRLNDIPRDRYTLIDIIPQHEMPFVYHRCDVAVFPNRVEAGTNMPLMECQACGIPTVATNTTGHGDVAGDCVSIIDSGKPVHSLIEHIEYIYKNPILAFSPAKEWTWGAMAEKVLAALCPSK